MYNFQYSIEKLARFREQLLQNNQSDSKSEQKVLEHQTNLQDINALSDYRGPTLLEGDLKLMKPKRIIIEGNGFLKSTSTRNAVR